MQQNERSRMLGEMPLTKLVPKLSIPIMVSMLVQALYNIVDSIYVSRFSANALTAVSLAYPVQMLMIALSVGMGVGINSLVSRKLGAGQKDESRVAAWNGLFIELAGFLIFLTVGLFFVPGIMNVLVDQTLANRETILQMGVTYLSIVTTWSLGVFSAVFFERMLQVTGNSLLSMVTQMSGAVVNIVLDPILIFGYLGFPSMGIAGAATATVIGQFTSAIIGFAFHQTKNKELALAFKDARLSVPLLSGILSVGFPSTIMQAIGSVMNLGMNKLLGSFDQVGNAAVNVLNVYFKLQSFVFMPVFGLGSGMLAIVGYNFGARNKKRVYESIRVSLTYAVSIMAVGTLVFQLFPQQLMDIFTAHSAQAAETAAGSEAVITQQMNAIGIVAMRIISINFIFSAIGITLSNIFQAVGRGTYSLTISICRQLAVLLPVAWLLKTVFGSVDAVWWSFTAAEVISLIISLLFFRKCNREMIVPLDGPKAAAS